MAVKKKPRRVPSWDKQQQMLVGIRTAEVEHGNLQYDFLERCGWTYTSNNPACIWGWEKTMPDGRVYFCPVDLAIRIQESLP